jgi:hypothetical protein
MSGAAVTVASVVVVLATIALFVVRANNNEHSTGSNLLCVCLFNRVVVRSCSAIAATSSTLWQWVGTDTNRSPRSVPLRHETIEESRELLIAIERKNVRDILVWPHDHHTAPIAIDATHSKDVVAAF